MTLSTLRFQDRNSDVRELDSFSRHQGWWWTIKESAVVVSCDVLDTVLEPAFIAEILPHTG